MPSDDESSNLDAAYDEGRGAPLSGCPPVKVGVDEKIHGERDSLLVAAGGSGPVTLVGSCACSDGVALPLMALGAVGLLRRRKRR